MMDIYQQEMALTSASNLLDLLARWILLSKKFLAPPTPISPTSMLTSLASWLRPGMDDNCPSLLQIYFKNMILFIRGPVDWRSWETLDLGGHVIVNQGKERSPIKGS